MKSNQSYVDWRLVAGLVGVGLLLFALALVGLHYLFLTSTLDTLAWLLSGSLIALPALTGFAFWLGKIEARGALRVIEPIITGLAPMQVASARTYGIMEREMDRRVNERMAREFLGNMEAVPQLTSGNGTRRVQGEIVDSGEVTL